MLENLGIHCNSWLFNETVRYSNLNGKEYRNI